MPRVFAATTGTPSAIASRTARPCPSSRDAETNAHQRRTNGATSGTGPVRRTASSSPASVIACRTRVGVGVVGDRADELEGEVGPGAAHPRERLDDGHLVLARLDPADEADDRTRLRGGARLGDPLEQIERPTARSEAAPGPRRAAPAAPDRRGRCRPRDRAGPGPTRPSCPSTPGGRRPSCSSARWRRRATARDRGRRRARRPGRRRGRGRCRVAARPAGGPAPPPMARTRWARGRRNRGARARRRRAAAAGAAPASRCRRASGRW